MTLATSRESLARLPFAEMSIFSSMLAPLNTQRVEAGLTLDRVAAVAGVPDEGVVARAEQCHVVSGAAYDDVIARAADDRVVAGAAIDGEIDLPGVDRGGIDRVVAGAAVDDQLSRCQADR